MGAVCLPLTHSPGAGVQQPRRRRPTLPPLLTPGVSTTSGRSALPRTTGPRSRPSSRRNQSRRPRRWGVTAAASMARATARVGWGTASSSLRSVVGADVYQLTETTASSLGLNIAALERVEPWLVALTLMDLGMTRLGYRSEQGLEQHLLLRAQRDRKPIYGLESVNDQIGVFDGLTSVEQEALLEQTLSELESAGQEMDELLNAWRDGSLATLTDKLSASFADFPGLYEALVIDRNHNWVPELERLARQPGRHLVVVGALHLVGEHNVVDLLRERGFDVEAYSLP